MQVLRQERQEQQEPAAVATTNPRGKILAQGPGVLLNVAILQTTKVAEQISDYVASKRQWGPRPAHDKIVSFLGEAWLKKLDDLYADPKLLNGAHNLKTLKALCKKLTKYTFRCVIYCCCVPDCLIINI